jgi:hypothetical protein
MPPTQSDLIFLERRKARRSVGLYLLPVALLGLVLAWGAFFVFWPISVNPYTVVGRIEQRLFEPGTLTMYAISATVLMNVVFALLALILVLAMVWASHERRYLKLVSGAQPPQAPSSPRDVEKMTGV